MKFNIQTKLFIALAGLTILILAGVLFLVTGTVSNQIQDKIITDFNNTQRVFSKQQKLVYDRLLESSYLIGLSPLFIANVSLGDPATVYFSVEEFASYALVDLFTVTDEDGKVLARLTDPDVYGDDLSSRAGVFMAMNAQEPNEEQEWPELWAIGDSIVQVVSQPIFRNDGLIGTLTLGRMLTEKEAFDLKGESKIDISFFYNDKLIGTTLDESQQDGILNFVRRNQAIIDTSLMLLEATPAFTDTIGGVEHFSFISPLGQGERAYYTATIPTSIERRILSNIQNNILVTAAVFFAITLIFAFFLGNNFSRPILQLSSGMNEVKAGNLDISVKPSTKDEIGALTQSFNEMVTGLRERLHLSKYVGSHTMEMVQKTSTTDVALGGKREDLTVLFSDIRGFTAFSENRDPEEVINMLNRYLGFQSDLVTKFTGSVDKFVGDEMFAIFTGENSTRNAIDCSIEIMKRVKQENVSTSAPINIGIGINHGPAILGNMGAQDRMDYTALGSTVNLGARLCSAAKPGQILIRKNLFDNLETDAKSGGVFLIAFKGISEKLKIVEVLSE